jgi:hypothetical protein
MMAGVGVALALAPCTESVMGSLPKSQAGVGSATSDTAMQVGGAIGVGVLGTVLNLRYRHLMAPVIARAHVSVAVQKVLDGSLGGALAVARLAPSKLGNELATLARRSFISGMDEALLIATAVVGVAALVIMLSLPNRGSEAPEGCDSRADVD